LRRRAGCAAGGRLPRRDRSLLRPRRPAPPDVAGVRRRRRGAARDRRLPRRAPRREPAARGGGAMIAPAATAPSGFERLRAIADAVLLEGYVLYPYRADAPKN